MIQRRSQMTETYMFDHTVRTAMGGFPVYVDRKDADGSSVSRIELDPRHSQRVVNHSPDGFNWGYGGSGPAQCALGILLYHTSNKDRALNSYHLFKEEVIAGIPDDTDKIVEIPATLVDAWLEEHEKFYWRKYKVTLMTRDRRGHKFYIVYHEESFYIFANSFREAKRVAKRAANLNDDVINARWKRWRAFSTMESDTHPDYVWYCSGCETREREDGRFSTISVARFVERGMEHTI